MKMIFDANGVSFQRQPEVNQSMLFMDMHRKHTIKKHSQTVINICKMRFKSNKDKCNTPMRAHEKIRAELNRNNQQN